MADFARGDWQAATPTIGRMIRRAPPFRCALAALLASLAALARANDVPTVYPMRFDQAHATTAIVVVKPSAVAELPPFSGCERITVMPCHVPFTFRAEVLATLAGPVTESPLNVASESHSGPAGLARAGEPRLLVLKSRDGQVVMPHDRWTPLTARRDGELFIVLYGARLPDWLPCGAIDLAEAIVAADFPSDIGQDMADSDGADDPVVRHPEIWRIDGAHANPRNGVRITRLAELMRGLATRGESTDCRRPR